jgi:hypothetical protein
VLFSDALKLADGLFCDRKSQGFRLGELHHGLDAGVITEKTRSLSLLLPGENAWRIFYLIKAKSSVDRRTRAIDIFRSGLRRMQIGDV